MADKEIPELTDGGAAAAGDLVHVVRGPNSRKATLAKVAGTGAYGDLSGRPTLGTAAALDAGTDPGDVPVLDNAGQIPAALLPSYVDDVIEAANFADLPTTGETGKIYVTLDDNKTWRWSGSAYVEISASPGSTDAVPEGATNLYFTAARVRAVVLTGISFATNAAVEATDSLLVALGKLQAQVTAAVSKLSGIEAGADVTDAANVAAAGAVMGTNFGSNGLMTRTAAGTYASRTLSAGVNVDISNADGAAGNPTIKASKTEIVTKTANATLALAEEGKTIEMNVAGANTLTVPPNASVAFPVGTVINVTQIGAGATTIAAGSGVTIRNRNGLKLAGQYAVATLYKRATNEWVCGGDLSS